jgi:RNA 3'-terminal phosphate cyclase (ATP)
MYCSSTQKMLNIDGSSGEGGGQLVRNAVALSAITGEPITITRIRAARDNKGLAAQHIAAIKAVASACDAECSGISPGSGTIIFSPQDLKYREVSVTVGTAGSIPLVIQAWLSVALCAGGILHITGGTEVLRSPTIDYLDHVLGSVLRSSGAEIDLDILKRGYFPEGGGEVTVRIEHKKMLPIMPDDDEDHPCCIFSCSSNLPDHVTQRQASAADALLCPWLGEPCTISLDRRTGPSTGSSCTACKGAKGGIALGKRGLPAEEVGRNAANALITEIKNPGTVDIHLSDQLLVPLALFGGSFSTSTLSSHAETVCWLLSRFGYDITVRRGIPMEFSV